MALSPEQELELLRLRKRKAMAAQSAPAPVASEPELPEYEGNRVQAFFKALGSGGYDTLQQVNAKLGMGETALATSRGIPYSERQAAIETMPEQIKADRDRNDAELAPARRAFPKTVGTGRFVGEVAPYIAATAPLGAAASGMKLAGRMGLGALDGALTGALASPEGETVGGAVSGAAMGGGVPALTALGGATGRGVARGVMKLKPEAAELSRRLGVQLPLTMSAQDGLGRSVYRGIIGNLWGAAGDLRAQGDVARHGLRRAAMKHAAPPGLDVPKSWSNLTETEMFDKMYTAWGKAFEPFKELPIDPGKLPRSRVVTEFVRDNVSGIDLDNVASGKDLTMIYKKINDAYSKMAPDQRDTVGRQLLDWMDESKRAVKGNFPVGSPEAKIVDQWRRTTKRWKSWTQLRGAENAAKDVAKEFTVSDLASASSQTGLSRKQTSLSRLGQKAVKGMEAMPKEGIFPELAALGVVGGGLGALGGYQAGGVEGAITGATLGIGGPIVFGKIMASPSVQRALVGNTELQKSLLEVINSAAPHAAKMSMVRQMLTNAGVVTSQQED